MKSSVCLFSCSKNGKELLKRQDLQCLRWQISAETDSEGLYPHGIFLKIIICTKSESKETVE